jgi:hypothetical protein
VIALLAVFIGADISTITLSGDVTTDGGDYVVVPFEVPAGTVEMEITHSDNSDNDILDWGVWQPDGAMRGWGGGNTENAIIGVETSSRSYLPGAIEAGTWELDVGKAKILSPSVHWTASITFRDAPTLAVETRTPWTPVTLESGPRWYKGDFHVHSRQSGDATATFDEIVTLARSRGLDFVALSDHNTVAHVDLVAAYQGGVSDFLFMRAVEVTTYGGHGNAVGIGDYVDHHIGLDGRAAAGIVADVVGQGGIFSVNHPLLDVGDLCIGCVWSHADTPWDQVTALEIQTGNYEFGVLAFTGQVIEMWDDLHDDDHRLTAIGGSDDHRAGQSTGMFSSPLGSPCTLVYADQLSEAAILEAVRSGRVIVNLRGPDDPLVELSLTSDHGGNAAIGETIAADRATLEAHVVGGMGTELEIHRNGTKVDEVVVASQDWTQSFPYTIDPGGDRFRAELTTGSDPIVVTNHIYATWVVAEMPKSEGCGCQLGARPSPGGLILLAMLLLRLRSGS